MKRTLKIIILSLICFVMDFQAPCAAASPPKVLVTVKPIHSLVAGIMEGVATPILLLDGTTSPHHHHLKPSEEQKLNGVDVIIWVGEIYETSLKKRIENCRNFAQIITVSHLNGVELFPYRSFRHDEGCQTGLRGVFSKNTHHCCCQSESSDRERDSHDFNHGNEDCREVSGKDGHLWLALNNAKILVTQIGQKLATIDRQHAPNYLANSKKVVKRLDALTLELSHELKAIKGRPYITFHDFTQYFDRYFGTTCVGVVRVNPSLAPSPKHLEDLKRQIEDKNGDVLFVEPQFNDRLVHLLAQDTPIKIAQLDYLGYGLEPGIDLYFEMMRRLAVDMKRALYKAPSPIMDAILDFDPGLGAAYRP